jgi:hypothetical protein
MRAPLLGLTVVSLLANGFFPLRAQTNTNTSVQLPNPQLANGPAYIQTNTNTNVPPASPQVAHENRSISFLTLAQQEQYAKARAKALADNPKLKTEGENVIKQGEALKPDGPAADRQAFIEKMNSHRQKLRQAMLKEDASLEPIFAEIDKHISEMKAKQLGQVQNPPDAAKVPPANPSTGN